MATAKKPAQDPKTAKVIEGQFTDTPEGWSQYWAVEFSAAREQGGEDWPGIKSWHEKAAKVVRRYRAQRKSGRNAPNDARLNVFAANVQTQRAILVGNTPKCEVSRRFEDAADDDARVAATMLERILNTGLENESKGFSAVIARCTEDRLLPGMCGSRVEFSCDFQTIPEVPAQTAVCPACGGSGQVAAPPPMAALTPMGGGLPPGPMPSGEPMACETCGGSGQREIAPAVPAQTKPCNEQADATYIHWRDQLWNPCRTPDELRWWAFSADMSRKHLIEAFGDEGKRIKLNLGKGKGKDEAGKETPWQRARVWEVWSKEHKRVFHYVEGHGRVLFHVDNPQGSDPLGLEDFWPLPLPMIANATTDAFLPTPDFEYAKDLYDEADELTTRIRGIVRAIKVAGAYDRANGALKRLLDDACELELIPVENWAAFMQKGGVSGAFQLLPIQEMVNTVQVLVQQRNLVIEQIFQITGLGDIIRGQQQQSETATTSAIKARFASVRLQDMQKEVARYATDLQRLRKEVIAKHFSVETIIERSCILQSEDGKTPEGQQRIMRAAQLIKDRHLDFRVVVKPEQISLQDWAQLKAQRAEVLTGLGQYFAAMVPFLQQIAPGGPAAIKAGISFVLRNAQWLVAGMPGASGVESSFDAFVAEVERIAEQAQQQAGQSQPPPKPDPKVQAQALKNQGEVQRAAAHTQGRLVEIAAETRADMARREHDARMDVATAAATSEAKMRLDALRSVEAVTGAPTMAPGGVA